MDDIELRKWMCNELGNIINEMLDIGYRPGTDDGYRFLLQKSGQLIREMRRIKVDG